ncbi:hypothetical protein [Methylorubrum extorquens]
MEELILFIFKSMLSMIAFVFKTIILICGLVAEIISYLYKTPFIQYVIGTETYKTLAYIFLLLSVLALIAIILLLIVLVFSRSNNSLDDYEEYYEDDDEIYRRAAGDVHNRTAKVKQYGASGLSKGPLAAGKRPYITFAEADARVVGAKRGPGNSWSVTVESNGTRISKTVFSGGSRGNVCFGKSQGNIEWGD